MEHFIPKYLSPGLIAIVVISSPCQLVLTSSTPASASGFKSDCGPVKPVPQKPQTAPNGDPTAAAGGGVNLKDSAPAKLSTADLLKSSQLWLTMKWGKIGASTKADPVLADSTLSETKSHEAVQQMMASPEVQERVDEWRQWYENIFAVVPKAVDEKPPIQQIRFGITVTVTRDRKIHAFSDFADGNQGEISATKYAGKIVEALRALDEQAILKFPASSNLQQVKFRLQTDGFEDVELQAIGNGLN